ncbi:CPBP family intramembrane glutamic endopeptidase [Actinoalloteichus spitiensis]|uniref:CPBP family intramembrane glutamic endopeptidase n=1 Tax=Actinoalloteichus spitiensis TaxID=252394 RepID=UPI0012F6E879|nr:type II CAAX endopeptidase family protein [Actinoalloteichus spitiensis]
MPSTPRSWFRPARPADPEVISDPGQRRAVVIELLIVFTATLGLSGLRSLLSLLDSLLRPTPLSEQSVAINVPQATIGLLDLARQLTSVLQLLSWGALGVYLLWRAGIALRRIGLDRAQVGRDFVRGAGLAAIIGVPGLAFYLVTRAIGINLTVLPSTLDEAWWRSVTLVLSAVGNSWAEEILVVGYLITRLRQLGWSENASLWFSAVLRGTYHLYQGFGGFLGNIVMGLVYARYWQRTNRLWALVVGHALIDVVAFVGYALLGPHLSWLP